MSVINFQALGVTYGVNSNSSLLHLLDRGDLIGLPLSDWKRLLIEINGTSEVYLLHRILINKILKYDVSEAVNAFKYNGKTYWLDKNTRTSLMNLATIATDNLELVLGDEIVTVSPETLVSFLKNLELYAYKCYVATAKHLADAQALRAEEDILNYDYTANYPEQLSL